MRNTQKPEASISHLNGLSLAVHSKWNTIQGEGPFAGSPASFIRLAGCNLQCPLCDTEYTKNRSVESIEDIKNWINDQPYSLVVVTGGEPFRQNLRDLAFAVRSTGKTLQIETNGTLWEKGFPVGLATIVCSPKNNNVHPDMAFVAKAWKYVLRHDAVDSLDGLPTSALGMQQRPKRPLNHSPVFLQPCDDKDPEINALNLQATVKSCMSFGYRLCLQMQKIISMP